jgi:folate-binding protein YgfZ
MTSPSDLAQEADALLTSAGVRLRDDLVLVHVRGDDRLTWLNGQVTTDVRKATPGHAVYALAVNVRGKIMADVWVLARGEELAVLLPASATDGVLESFERQIIMDDVTLVRDDALTVISIQGPRAAELLTAAGLAELEHHVCDELGVGGLFAIVTRTQAATALERASAASAAIGGAPISDAGFELARLRRGRPRYGTDFGIEHYPQEAGLEERAVAFDKGCYLGQEVVCTLENRGRLNRALVRLRGQAAVPAAGGAIMLPTSESTPEGVQVGQITSAAIEPDGVVHALGYVKRAQAAAGTSLLVSGTSLSVLGPTT